MKDKSGGLTKTLKSGESFTTLTGETIINLDQRSIRIKIIKKPEGIELGSKDHENTETV